MHTRKEVVTKLRDAASALQNLTDENNTLKRNNAELLEKIASLEADVSIADDKIAHTALQKEAANGFSLRDENMFGSSISGLPGGNSNLSSEEKLDMILNGESPSDYQ